MDFSPIELSDRALAFWDDEVVPFFDTALSDEVLASEWREGNGVVPDLERDLAARGWIDATGLGLDRDLIDPVLLAIVRAEEAIRVGAMLPVRGSHRLVMSMLQAFASNELRGKLYPGIARGEIICCLGYTEPDCGSDAAAITTRAVRDGQEWIVTGQKMFSTGAHRAQYAAITARTNPDVPKHEGITMFLIPLHLDGVEIRGIGTLGGERTNFIHLDGVRVPDAHRLGPVDQGWKVASGALAAEHGMDEDHGGLQRPAARGEAFDALAGIVGGWTTELGRLYDAVVDWATAPNGPAGARPIDDPAIRQRLARVAVDVEIIRVTPDPYARIVTSDLFIRDSELLLDLVGSAGLMPRAAPGAILDGDLEWGDRFAQGTSIYGGTTDIQRNLIAEQFLGLPRHRGLLRR